MLNEDQKALKTGLLSASYAPAVLKGGKGLAALVQKIANERVTNIMADVYQSDAMRRGAWLEQFVFTEIGEKENINPNGEIQISEIAPNVYVGATVDGLGADCNVEIKIPLRQNYPTSEDAFIEFYRVHEPQLMFQQIVTGYPSMLLVCDFKDEDEDEEPDIYGKLPKLETPILEHYRKFPYGRIREEKIANIREKIIEAENLISRETLRMKGLLPAETSGVTANI